MKAREKLQRRFLDMETLAHWKERSTRLSLWRNDYSRIFSSFFTVGFGFCSFLEWTCNETSHSVSYPWARMVDNLASVRALACGMIFLKQHEYIYG